jgi:DNA repair protein RadD
MRLEPRYYQKDAVNSLFDYFKKCSGNPLVEIPTGGGKSLVLSLFIEKALCLYPKTRILVVTHQKELIKQNHAEFVEQTGYKNVGIYSAGLKKRDIDSQVLFCGIQSVHRKAWQLGPYDLMIIDEAHLLPKKGQGMYLNFISEMRKQNKFFKIIGLTATPYRLDTGLLCEGEGRIFTDICYSVSVAELISKGFLSPLVSINSSKETKVDRAGLHLRGGEYIIGEMAALLDQKELIRKTVAEIIVKAQGRKSILIFCVNIEHAEHVAGEFIKQGEPAKAVHSKIDSKENDETLHKFKSRALRVVCNVDILTTGFNAKNIDCIAMLRLTKSAGLYYQMVGRGLRLFLGKANCLILDFAGNIAEHGPVDRIEVKSKTLLANGEVSKCPMKECPECNHLIYPSQMECPECGYIYEKILKHDHKASTLNVIHKYEPPKEYEVQRVFFGRHKKKGKPDSLRIDFYYSMLNKFSTWLCIEHSGFAKQKAITTLKKFADFDDIDYTIDSVLGRRDELKKPKIIIVDENGKYPEIKEIIF